MSFAGILLPQSVCGLSSNALMWVPKRRSWIIPVVKVPQEATSAEHDFAGSNICFIPAVPQLMATVRVTVCTLGAGCLSSRCPCVAAMMPSLTRRPAQDTSCRRAAGGQLYTCSPSLRWSQYCAVKPPLVRDPKMQRNPSNAPIPKFNAALISVKIQVGITFCASLLLP